MKGESYRLFLGTRNGTEIWAKFGDDEDAFESYKEFEARMTRTAFEKYVQAMGQDNRKACLVQLQMERMKAYEAWKQTRKS